MTKPEAEATYLERSFMLVDSVTPLKQDWHRKRFATNVWTDDTDLALCILLGYFHNGKTDATDFANCLHVWVHQGVRALKTMLLGLGATIAAAVEDSEYLDDPVGVSYRAWQKGNYYGAANGSLMRRYPLGAICVFRSLTETFERATEYGLLTHPNPRCTASCCILVGLIRALLLCEVRDNRDINSMIKEAVKRTDERVTATSQRLDKADPGRQAESSLDRKQLWEHVNEEVGDLYQLELDEHGKIGYVYKALGAAIYVQRREICR